MTRQRRALLLLMILSSFCAEFLTGSVSFSELAAHPLLPIAVVPFYACGVALAREWGVKLGGSLQAFLFLGLAYGILEEGIAIQSFTNPAHVDLADIDYSRLFGIQWMWSISITAVHAVVSILIPITLTHVAYPDLRRVRLLSRNGEWWCIGILLSLTVLVARVTITHQPPFLPYIGIILAFFACIWMAMRLRIPLSPAPSVSPPWRFAVGSFALTTLFFPGIAILTGFHPSPILMIIALLLFLLWIVRRRLRFALSPLWSARHAVASALGVLWFFPFFTSLFLRDLLAIVTIPVLIGLSFLSWRRAGEIAKE